MSSNDLSYVDGGTLEFEPSIFSHFFRVLGSSPTNIAIRVVHQQAGHLQDLKEPSERQLNTNGNLDRQSLSCLSWTYEQLHHAAVQVVHGFHLRGITAGSTLVCLVPNGIEWVIVLWASILGKFTLSSLDFGVLNAPRALELQMLLGKIKPDVIFVPDENGATAIDMALRSQQPMPKVKVIFQPRNGQLSKDDGATSWTSLQNLTHRSISKEVRTRIEEEALQDDHNRSAMILFTSGTTLGTPKGCIHTVRDTLHFLNQNWDNGYTRPPHRLLQTTNFRIIAPTLAMSTWALAGTVVLPSAMYSPKAMLEALRNEEFAISCCLYIPAQLHGVVAQDDFATVSEQIANRGDLKVVNLGGDIITEDLYNKACTAFPSADVRVGHGMTEGGVVFTWPAERRYPPSHAGIVPVGKPTDGTRLKIAAGAADGTAGERHERGIPLKRSVVGELHVWNPSFISGYLDGVNAQDFYTDKDGNKWFDTGDMALMDQEDWIYILGRKKDIIKRAGVPITPGAIENSLGTYLRSYTSVVGVPHPTLGQAPIAVVKSLGQSTKEDVKKHVIALFGPDYGLGDVLTLQELNLDDFPVNATGKILKRELLNRIALLAQ